MKDDAEVEEVSHELEQAINEWLTKYRYVWVKQDGTCVGVLPELDFDVARDFARTEGFELLSLTKQSTQERVAKFLLDRWVQTAREEGQRALAELSSPLPAKGGEA